MTDFEFVLIVKNGLKTVLLIGLMLRKGPMKINFGHRIYMNTLSMIITAMLTLPLAAPPALASGSTTPAAKKTTTSRLPLIDTAAPSRFETASFGLG